jgi:hypothetical protein
VGALDPAAAALRPAVLTAASSSAREPVAVPAVAPAPCDDTADAPDTAMTLADEFSQRAEVLMLAQQSHQQELQARLDRMKADFNAAQEERSERMREMNALRDMAVEQEKKDDEILKKFIAMI